MGAGSCFAAGTVGLVAQLPCAARSEYLTALGPRLDVAGTFAPRIAVHPGGFYRVLERGQHRCGGPDAHPLLIHIVSALACIYAGHQEEDGSSQLFYSTAATGSRAAKSRLANLVHLRVVVASSKDCFSLMRPVSENTPSETV